MNTLAYSIAAAAEATGLSVSTLRRAIGEGTLRARTTGLDDRTGKPKRGARLVIRATDLEAFLDSLPEA